MPSSTASQGLPYPLNTDLVTNGAADMQALAEAVDGKLNVAHFHYRRSTDLSVADVSTGVEIPWEEVVRDDLAAFTLNAVDLSLAPGLWLLAANIQWAGVSSGYRGIAVEDAAGVTLAGQGGPGGINNFIVNNNVNVVVDAPTATTVSIRGWQNSGGALNAEGARGSGGSAGTWVSGTRLVDYA